jgi:hypothetical protein
MTLVHCRQCNTAATRVRGPGIPSRSFYEGCSTTTSRAFALCFSDFGRWTSRMPSLNSAFSLVSSTSSGSVKDRANPRVDVSYFFLFLSN